MSEQDLEVLKEFQNRKQSDNRCCTCGSAIDIDRAGTTSYCLLCSYITKYKFTHRKKLPIRNESGYYLIVNSKMCKADCAELHCLGYFNQNLGYIYLNLLGIEKKGKDEFISNLLAVINHEVFHWAVFNLEDGITSTLLDSPSARRFLDQLHGFKDSIYIKMSKSERDKRYMKWLN